eukprot:scaffold6246_cov98-Isochrysis_galbana.AAC.6
MSSSQTRRAASATASPRWRASDPPTGLGGRRPALPASQPRMGAGCRPGPGGEGCARAPILPASANADSDSGSENKVVNQRQSRRAQHGVQLLGFRC